MLTRSISVACILLAVAGCRSAPKEASARETKPEAKAAAADPNGMCKEHGVLEAICTKCNPKLIPVFQAKGDWCGEHGLPESVCPICHPERGGRPSADVASDGAPADGMRVKFRRSDTAKLAGIEIAKALARPSAAALTAPARLAYDATKLAQVNARSPGVVRSLKVDVGTQVKKGDPLVVIDSPNVGADRARLSAAKARIQVAEENFARATQLEKEGIASRKNLLEAQQDLDLAKSEHAALSASLSVFGAGGGGVGSYTLSAPIDGVVTERRATIGKLVNGDEVLFEVVDTSSMWADVEIAENDLPAVGVGQVVSLRIDSLGEREISGAITYVAPSVDPHTRTSKARVPLMNADGVLRANMYGHARIAAGAARTNVVVPRAAVQRAKNVQLVFVRVSANEYETRRVQLGTADAEFIEIVKGIRPGEEVVTTGSFLLKTETLKDSIGAGCCEGE
jgi:cobalt-zinc-cadmium efflux system membrane fusion protein